jgi:upstream activation factor subunit UAF30
MANTSDVLVQIESLRNEFKALRKDIRKIRQFIEDPTGEKAKARSQNNGFRKPQNVSDELKSFLGLANDEKISRADVTRRVNEYVTARNLKCGQKISMDDKLSSLLTPPADVEITFLNIQKYLNRHYIKDEPKAVEPVQVPVVEKKKPTLKKST